MPADSMPDLSWLADSPVFIDGQQGGAFYDAVVGPAFRAVELQVTASWAEQVEESTAGHLNAGLSALFPWLRVDAGVEAPEGRNTGPAGRPDRYLAAGRQRCAPTDAAVVALPSEPASGSAQLTRTPQFRAPKRLPRARG